MEEEEEEEEEEKKKEKEELFLPFPSLPFPLAVASTVVSRQAEQEQKEEEEEKSSIGSSRKRLEAAFYPRREKGCTRLLLVQGHLRRRGGPPSRSLVHLVRPGQPGQEMDR